MIPAGWKHTTVRAVCDRVSVGIVVRPAQYYVEAEAGVRAYRSANVGEGYIRDNDWVYISRSGHESNKKSELKSGDVLVVRSGNAGVACVVPPIHNGSNCIDIVFARPKTNIILPEYLCELTNSEYGRRQVKRLQGGLALTHLNVGSYENIVILIPPKHEQQEIIKIANLWGRAIDLTEKLLTEKQQIRSGLMQLLLTGKRRLPGITKPWRTIHLGDAFRNRVESNRTDLPLLSIAADRGVIPRGEIDRKDSSSEDKSKYLRICPGDIGYNTMRMWQGVSGLSSLEGIVSPAYTIVTPKKGIDGEFMSLLFKSLPVVHLFCRYSQGLVSDTWNLKFRHFAEIMVSVPDEAEQKAIANAFRSVNRELELLQAKADGLREQKKGLMQQLLTGKKRVTTCAT